jgi:hypothetical protein
MLACITTKFRACDLMSTMLNNQFHSKLDKKNNLYPKAFQSSVEDYDVDET